MTKLELEQIAVEVRKGIITGVHSANPVIRVDLYPQQRFLLICIL